MQKEIKNTPYLLNSNFLNFIPLICSIMVVQIHSFSIGNLPKTSIQALIISFFAHGICTTAVPIFFFMSGYLFFRNSETLADVFKKQRKRLITVLLPFIAWSTFYFLIYAVGYKFLPFINTDVNLSFWGVLKSIIFFEYSFPLWYMFQLCIYIMLTPLIFYILRNKYITLLILLFCCIMGFIAPDIITVFLGELKRNIFLFNFFSYFLIGCILAKYPQIADFVLKISKKINIIIPILTLVIFSCLEALIFEEILPFFNTRAVVPLVFVSFLILALKICDTEIKLPKSTVSTMVIYGIHSIVGLLLSRLVLSHFAIPPLPRHFIALILTFITSFLIGYILKYIKPLYFVFSGNR